MKFEPARYLHHLWQALLRRVRGAGTRPEGMSAPPGDVARLQASVEQLRQQDAHALQDLQQRIGALEAERDATRGELDRLRTALADAAARQEHSEHRAHVLERRLRDQQTQHQAELQAALARERRYARRLNLALGAAIAACVLGGVLSVITYRLADNQARLLDAINQGIGDIHARLGARPADMPEAPAVARQESVPEATPAAPARGITAPPPAPTLPAPDFVASDSLPLADHAFGSRRDVRAFFEENARQPGVTTLPGGVQYRVLIPGDGRTPEAADTVTIEYRAFRPDGTELDNSFRATQPSTFVVAAATPGLREALQHMPEGAQWELYIPPELITGGVRKRGRFGFEPLICTVELLSIDTAAAPGQMQQGLP